ncbi:MULTISPECIES: MipA/OmpV family protein [Burkholderia]|uniref:MipA/OmpV family protein n=1 Tax=Burkholderia TaxID=32008 RepID=UPI00141E55C3|nr:MULTISPECIES: MipA/OmpV family protein [Burkholderia]NIE87971.1 MipA/OmpV family protein [Burkholderia sp. Tr-860]NIF67102.1 MipA/OmpV family protein [Burkholderia sp. Cy-647]NIF72214.1 MipA/OmpV family protein [Burkholderia sp. Ap-962]NIG00467.1 MipA/OmpV family protein [Burkholderia sp. Ax-1720]
MKPVLSRSMPGAASRAATITLAAALACAAPLAQADTDAESGSGATAVAGSAASGASPWKITIGPGVYVAPQYPGSRHLKAYPFPALDISYRDRFFSQGPDVLGWNVLSSGDTYHLGMAVSFDFQSRDAKDDARLRGLPDVHDGPKLKLFADYTIWAFTGALAVYRDVLGYGQGTTASADLYASLPLNGWLFSIGPGLTWANGAYTRTLFGISPAESAASGLPSYGTGSGVRDVHLNFYMTHDFSRHWVGTLNSTLGRLQRFAASSPITERRTEWTTFASLGYRF